MTTEEILKELELTQQQANIIIETAILRLIRQSIVKQFDLPDNALQLLDEREDLFHKLGLFT